MERALTYCTNIHPGESWADEQTVMGYWSTRLHCRFENASKAKDQWQNCEAKLPE
jgi:hypothetical protein